MITRVCPVLLNHFLTLSHHNVTLYPMCVCVLQGLGDSCWWDLYICEWNLGSGHRVRPRVWVPLELWCQLLEPVASLSSNHWVRNSVFSQKTATVGTRASEVSERQHQWPERDCASQSVCLVPAAGVHKLGFSGQKNLVQCCFKETLHIISSKNRFQIAFQSPISLLQIFC